MVEIDNEPELPDIFPQDVVTVEGEEHTFNVAETDSGTQAQYEYTLDKAPVSEITSVQGTDQSGSPRTFINGTDYTLSAKTERVTDSFTFDEDTSSYIIRYTVDQNTDSVIDESGNTYTSGTDYLIAGTDDHYGDLFEWIDSGDSPENGENFTVVYDTTFENSVLEWQQNASNLPSANTKFYVTYSGESVISRYLAAHENELSDVEDSLNETVNNKFIDQASGDSLDELGKLFGPVIGQRRGRTDTDYRVYLKSIVQSFISRGTVNGIKLSVSAATGIPLEDIDINEDFTDLAYEVSVQANTAVTGSLLEDVAEIADPSGVDQLRTRFVVDPDEMSVDEGTSITEGLQLSDQASVSDSTANFGFGTEGAVFDVSAASDSTQTNPNKIAAGADTSSSDDTASFTQESVTWGNNWNKFDWAGATGDDFE